MGQIYDCGEAFEIIAPRLNPPAGKRGVEGVSASLNHMIQIFTVNSQLFIYQF